MGNEIAYAAFDLLAGIIDPDLGTDLFQISLKPHRNFVFLKRVAIDLYQLNEQIF